MSSECIEIRMQSNSNEYDEKTMVTKVLKEINTRLFKAEHEVAKLRKQRQKMLNSLECNKTQSSKEMNK